MTDIRPATARDAKPIETLLQSTGLPVADLPSAKPFFLVAFDGNALVGVAGIESLGEAALVRSVAVVPSYRSQGVGRLLVDRIEAQATKAGVKQLILLTETARVFFLRAGYRVIDRAEVPAAVQACEEFRSLCPQSATCMSKSL